MEEEILLTINPLKKQPLPPSFHHIGYAPGTSIQYVYESRGITYYTMDYGDTNTYTRVIAKIRVTIVNTHRVAQSRGERMLQVGMVQLVVY